MFLDIINLYLEIKNSFLIMILLSMINIMNYILNMFFLALKYILLYLYIA